MAKHSKLTVVEQAQIVSFLKIFDKDESIPIFPSENWSNFEDCGLTPAVYKKILNKIAEIGYIRFENLAGFASFKLTKVGQEWLEEADNGTD